MATVKFFLQDLNNQLQYNEDNNMAQLSTKIKLYATANNVTTVNFKTEVLLQDDGSGAYIKEWNLDITEPTAEQLASYETAGFTESCILCNLRSHSLIYT